MFIGVGMVEMLVEVVVEGSYRFVLVVGRACRLVVFVFQEWERGYWFVVGGGLYQDPEIGKQTVIFKMKREKIKIMIGRRVTVDVVFKFFLSSSIFFSSSTHINPIV
jgi:hypothetical protein